MSAATAERLRIEMSSPQSVPYTDAVLWRPHADRAGLAFVLAHGAGSDLTSPILRAVGRGLAEHGFPAIAFNFPYAQAGNKRPDPAVRLESAYRDAIAVVQGVLGPERPLVLGGRSMGGRIATHLAAAGLRCAGLVLLAYPLHPAGRPEKLRTGHWAKLGVPLLFLSGDRDRLCDLDLLDRERLAHLRGVAHRLHVLAGCDHSFAVRASEGRAEGEVLAEIVSVISGWAEALMPQGPRR